MTAHTLSFLYGRLTAAATTSFRLEQPPMDDAHLTIEDLDALLALARAGISGKAYLQPTCPSWIEGNEVVVSLLFWVWPLDLRVPYSMAVNLGTLGIPKQVEVEREFDLVVDFARQVELPYYCRVLTWEWSALPCWDTSGNEVDRPVVSVSPTSISFSAEVFSVIRVRCLAVGAAWPVTLRFQKTANTEVVSETTGKLIRMTVTDLRISSVRAIATCTWQEGAETKTEILALDLPVCATDLLESCADGTLKRSAAGGGQGRPEVKYVPTVYFNPCDGEVMEMRYERA